MWNKATPGIRGFGIGDLRGCPVPVHQTIVGTMGQKTSGLESENICKGQVCRRTAAVYMKMHLQTDNRSGTVENFVRLLEICRTVIPE